MTAMAGASGFRAWLQTRGWTFLTPARLRRATIAGFAVATLIATIGLSGSSTPTAHPDRAAAAPAAAARAARAWPDRWGARPWRRGRRPGDWRR